MKRLLRRCLLGLLSLSMCVMTSGCWSAFEIQQVDYAKAFGGSNTLQHGLRVQTRRLGIGKCFAYTHHARGNGNLVAHFGMLPGSRLALQRTQQLLQ